jgi:hypothetical protein
VRIKLLGLVWTCCGSLALLAPGLVRADENEGQALMPPAEEAPAHSAWPSAELTVGIQARDSETEGLGDVLVPILNPGGKGLLFVNPRSTITDRSEEQYNLGVGYRQWLPKLNAILGVNAYYDYSEVPTGTYDQWGVGVEVLTPWIDARANYYDPEDASRVVASETETTRSQSTRTIVDDWSDPYATGNAVVQDYTLTRRTTTETRTRTFERHQQAFGGYDAEIGLRLPLPAKPETFDVRVFAGYYDFGRDFGADVDGWKARAEMRVLSSLYLDAGVYEDDQLTGSDWYAGARLNVPLDLAALSRGRNPFAAARSRLEGAPRDFSARLTEMVLRDPRIHLETSDFIENAALATLETSRRSSSTRNRLTLLSDAVFVDADAAWGAGTGERPYSTIQQGVDAAFGLRNVYVFAASESYKENVVLRPGITLWGSGVAIQGADGRTFGGERLPVVDGMSQGPAITLASGTTVKGFEIRNAENGGPSRMSSVPGLAPVETRRVGLFGDNATDVVVAHNLFEGNEIGALFLRKGDLNLMLEDNLFVGNSSDGLRVVGEGNSGFFNVVSIQNTFMGNGGDGANVQATQYDAAMVQLFDNLFWRNGGDGLRVGMSNVGDAYFVGVGVGSFFNGGDGVEIEQTDAEQAFAWLGDAALDLNGGHGLRLHQSASEIAQAWAGYDPSPIFAELSPIVGESLAVRANQNAGAGISIEQRAAPGHAMAALVGVEASGNGEQGVLLDAEGESSAAVIVWDVVASSNALSGLDWRIVSSNGYSGAYLRETRASGNGQYGARLSLDAAGDALAAISGSWFGGNGLDDDDLARDRVLYDGLRMRLRAGGDLDVLIDSSYFVDNAGRGASITAYGGEGATTMLISNVVAAANGFQGLDVTALGNGGSLVLSVENSQILANRHVGADLLATGYDSSYVSVRHSRMDANDWFGLRAIAFDMPVSMVSVVDVQADENKLGGITVYQSDSGLSIANLSGISAHDNGEHGVILEQISEVAMALIGMPDTLGEWMNDLLGADMLAQMGIELPDGMEGPFTSSGPVSVVGNGMDGISASVKADLMALAAIFDVEANQNDGNGITALVESESGTAAGMVGSSKNFSELLELVGGLADVADGLSDFGIGLPGVGGLLPELVGLGAFGDGLLQANDNGQHGLLLGVNGSMAAGIVVGAETSGNADLGTSAVVESPTGGAIAFAARIDAQDNGGDGLTLGVLGEEFAVGVMADVNASNNQGNGILAEVAATQGLGLLLGFSTDALRPLADLLGEEFLGESFEFPGDPFGPLVASGNGASGIEASVMGQSLAAAVVIDAQASNNATNGISLGVLSPEGSAIAAVLSSDLLYEALPEAFGQDEMESAGLGDVQANDNGLHGIALNVTGLHGAAALVGGVSASGNAASGIDVGLLSQEGAAQAYLVHVEAIANESDGIALGLMSHVDNASANLIYVDASENVGNGIFVFGNSLDDDALAMLAGVTAANNGGNGISAFLNGGDDAALVVSGADLSGNADYGLNATLFGADNSYFFAGSRAIERYDELYGFGGGILGLYDMIPQGDVFADQNGIDGINALVFAGSGESVAEIYGATANDNGRNGIEMIQLSMGTLQSFFGDVEANDNGGQGLGLELAALGDVYLGFEGIAANGNDSNNVSFLALSQSNSVYAIMAGVEASGSEQGAGIAAEFVAASNVAFAVTDAVADGNAQEGITVSAQAGNDVDLYVGASAIANFNDDHGAAVADTLIDVFVDDQQGPVQLIGNGLQGLDADLVAGGNLNVELPSVVASSNGLHGVRINAEADGDAQMFLINVTADDNGFGDGDVARAGIRLNAEAEGDISAILFLSATSGNSGNGVHFDLFSQNGDVVGC